MGNATLAQYIRNDDSNPFSAFNMGAHPNVDCFDMDNDGDLDCVFGQQTGQVLFCVNTGSRTIPRFEARTTNLNPLELIQVGHAGGGFSAPCCVDLDSDG